MKSFLLKILVFSALFFILEKPAWLLLDSAPERQYDKRLEALLNGKVNKDLIVLGSSRGAGNILAGQIEKETGLSSYNLSYQGSNVSFHQFILETLIEFNKTPKKVILTIDNPTYLKSDNSVRFRVDALQPLTKYNYINSKLIKEKANNPLSNFFYLSRLNSSHFRFKTNKAPSMNPLDSFGTMPLIKKNNIDLVYKIKLAEYNSKEEKESKLNAFRNIQNLCSENNIELIYVFSPDFRPFNLSFFNRFKKLVNKKEKLIIYDSLNSVYKNEKYFYDYAHLLQNGAEIFTSEISTFINQNK
ncbi:hypothetical protein [Olleya sp. R77988]|uniref:hypothetical protein n=1 Tax=Olleya sp. R77988 TaxID=3093875 RepID=UPI0037C7E9B7